MRQLYGLSSEVLPHQTLKAAAAKSLQSCPTLCDPTDGSLPGSSIPGILQARTLEWVAISFSNAWKWKVKVKSLSRVWLLATPWTATYQAPPSMGVSRQEYWSGVPLPSPHWRLGRPGQGLREGLVFPSKETDLNRQECEGAGKALNCCLRTSQDLQVGLEWFDGHGLFIWLLVFLGLCSFISVLVSKHIVGSRIFI